MTDQSFAGDYGFERRNSLLMHEWRRWWERVYEDYVPEYREKHGHGPTQKQIDRHTERMRAILADRYGGSADPDYRWLQQNFPGFDPTADPHKPKQSNWNPADEDSRWP